MTAPGLDVPRLAAFLGERVPGGLSGELRCELISGGRSNLTYVIGDDDRTWVLRRPPLGHVLATAHDMLREARVIGALRDTAVPVPAIVTVCPDPAVVGAPFYVMSKVEGTVLRSDADLARVSPDAATAIATALIDTIAALHLVRADEVGLGDFGRPHGFAERQVRRWRKQREASRLRDVPGMERLAEDLARTVPTHGAAALVHGDYRLDNVIVDLPRHRLAAVLDWEMATLGDPLTDLGLAHLYWVGWEGIENPIAGTPGAQPHFPAWPDLLERYARRTGFALDHLDWYVGFAFYKLAVVLEGIHYRHQTGHTTGAGFGGIGAMVPHLVERGRAALART